jgi:hypothetical protein
MIQLKMNVNQKQCMVQGQRRSFRALFCALGLVASSLSGCAHFEPTTAPSNPAMLNRGPLTALEVQQLLAAGVSSENIMSAVRRRGAEPLSSEDVELLRQAGAPHPLVNTLLQVNQPERYVWVSPPRFSFYYGRGGWYWVDAFGWPVYPQPGYGWAPHRIHHGYPVLPARPVKPSPKQPTEDPEAQADKPKVTKPVAPKELKKEAEPRGISPR